MKREIEDVLLRKRDRRRTLRAELELNDSRRAELESIRASTQGKLDRAKLVLSCKTGNFKSCCAMIRW